MIKTHTTTQTLTANAFNSHDETGDGVLWLGPVLFDGTVVTIGGYKVRYNGIIVEDSTIVTHDTAGYKYLCLSGIDASPSSAPYSLVSNVKQGICLIEKYKEGWITKSLKFNENLRGLAFTRTTDVTGGLYYASFGPGVCEDGTIVHTPIKIQTSLDVATGSGLGITDQFLIDNTNNLGTILAYGCNEHLVIYTLDGTPDVIINNDNLFTVDTIPGVAGSCLAVMETSDTTCVYAYTVADHLFVGVNTYGVGPAAPVDYTMTDSVTKLDFVTPTTMLVQLADNTFLYGMLTPGTFDILFSGSSRWFHVDHKNSDFVHIGMDFKLYKNTVEIGSCTNRVLIFDGKLIQVTPTGEIIDGGKTTATGYSVLDIVANRTPANELFMLFINVAGMDAVSYSPTRCETTYSANIAAGATIGAVTFGYNITNVYAGDDMITYHQPVSVGSLTSLSDIEIVPSLTNQWRFGKKHFQLDKDHLADTVYVGSNTNGIITHQVGALYAGILGSHTISSIILGTTSLLVGPRLSDGDCVQSLHIPSNTHHFTKCLAFDYNGDTNAALLTKTPVGTIAAGACATISSGISISGGLVATMEVYAIDSVISNMEIQTLNIRIARNVMFVGCNFGAYTDFAVAPEVNTYRFVGCTLAGVPIGMSFLALSDTPAAYVSAGDMLVTNPGATGLEFAVAARQTPAGELQFARQDMVNGLLTPAWDQPAASEINQSTKDPTGFESISNCTISYDPAVRIVTLAFTGDTIIWFHGVRHKFTNGQSFVWADHTDNTNTYFFYLRDDGAGGLEAAPVATVFWDLSAVVPVTYVIYKDTGDGGPDGFHNEERHDHTWPWSIHRDVHLQRGAWSLEDGFAASGYLVGGNAIANKKVDLDGGTIIDEDLWNTVAPLVMPDTYVHFYLNAAGDWTWNKGEVFPVPYTGSAVPGTVQNPKYNEIGVGLTEVALNNRWFNTYIFATNSLDPVFRFVVIIGQTVYTSLAAAQGAGLGSLSLGNNGAFPFQECVALYQITWRRGSYDLNLAYNPYARIDALTRIIGERITVTGLSSTNHAALTGRDLPNSHPSTAIGYASAEFDYGAGLEPVLTCDQVQEALDQVITRFTGDATWVAGPTFTNYLATPTWVSAIGDARLVSITVDVLGVEISTGDMCHRKILATLSRDGAGAYTILVQDHEIVYEDATFTTARLDPATYLSGIGDYVEVTETGTAFSVTCGAISTFAKCRYSVNIFINELITVNKAPA